MTAAARRTFLRLLLAPIALIAAVTLAGAGQANALAGPNGFGLAPAPTVHHRNLPYFSLTIQPGHSTRASLLVQNFQDRSTQVRLLASTGATAPNSGDSYNLYPNRCRGTGCWIRGLPTAVTIPAKSERAVPFTVSVPAGTPDRQYLAGVTAEPAALPAPVVVGSNGISSAKAVIVDQVTVGVAVTVGNASGLHTHMSIPTLQGGAEMTIPRLLLHLANTGQTFSKATGRVSCQVGTKTDHFTVVADTVLPHQQAIMPINAPSIGFNKTIPCHARITYRNDRIATWSGLVKMPATLKPAKTYRTGAGDFTTLPASGGIPTWALVLIIIGSLCLAGMVCLTVWILKNRVPPPR